MNELEDGTCGFVLPVMKPEHYCQICTAQLEKRGKATWGANAAEYEFRADTGESVFFCGECFDEYFSPESEEQEPGSAVGPRRQCSVEKKRSER
jgi:hypothetical protein